MKFLAIIFVCLSIFFAVISCIYLIRVAFVHIKAFIIRRKLSKLAETEKKDD